MTQVYSDPEHESDPHALPNFEVFRVFPDEAQQFAEQWAEQEDEWELDSREYVGWYYWACFPGCISDSDPTGPFETEESAIADLRE